MSSRPTPSTPPAVIALQAVARARSSQNSPTVPSIHTQSSVSPATPRDCVREYPSSAPDSVELKAFDWSGQVRHTMNVPIADNVQAWARLMLTQCRKTFPRPHQLKLVD